MKTNTQLLETAIHIASNAHLGQVDKAGEPYILHPMRVMQSCNSIEAKIAAMLHDVVEDTDVSFADLEKRGIPKEILDSLQLLTHDDNVPYMEYIENLKQNSIAREVKLADLKDNIDISRLKELTEKDLQRLQKYHKALQILNAQIL